MISIVIPLYNAESSIVETLESVRAQTTAHPFELIVVNDGSTDRSSEIVQNWFADHPEISARIITQPNSGVSQARNRGVQESRGQWIAFLDSDDCWSSEKLSVQMNQIEQNPSIQFIGTDRNDEQFPFSRSTSDVLVTMTVPDLLLHWRIHVSSILIRRDLLTDQIWFDPSMKRCEDADFLLRVAQKTTLFVVNKSLLLTGGGKQTFGESGLSADAHAMRVGERLAVKRAFLRKQISLVTYALFFAIQEIKHWRRVVILFAQKQR